MKRRIRQRQRLAPETDDVGGSQGGRGDHQPHPPGPGAQYDREMWRPPLLLAKGEGHLARKIREVAEEHRIDGPEPSPGPGALPGGGGGGDPGSLLPRKLREVLAFVYRLEGTGVPVIIER